MTLRSGAKKDSPPSVIPPFFVAARGRTEFRLPPQNTSGRRILDVDMNESAVVGFEALADGAIFIFQRRKAGYAMAA